MTTETEIIDRIGRKFIVPGCPVAEGKGGCVVTCAGNWPGTRITSQRLTKAILDGRITYESLKKLGCGSLRQNARWGLEELKRRSNTK